MKINHNISAQLAKVNLKNLKENSSLDNIQIKMLTGVFAHLGASGLNIISKIFSNAPTETIEKIKSAFYESVQNRTIMPCRTLIEQKSAKSLVDARRL